MKLASDFFSGMQVRVVLEKAGIKLDISKRKKKSANVILESLEKLHELASKRKKKVILFMDEFQVVGEVTKNHSVEAAIREAAQKSSHVAYVFSGSNRHLLQQMFYDKKRPFYKLCDLITLDRISEDAYITYIQKAAIHQWGEKLQEDVMQEIFIITERHPYYINKLCSLMFLGKYPNQISVQQLWSDYTIENRSMVERELELLTLNQRKLLINLSKYGPTKELFSKEFSAQLGLSLSSISRSLSLLCEKDYVCIDKNGYHKILDPLVKSILS